MDQVVLSENKMEYVKPCEAIAILCKGKTLCVPIDQILYVSRLGSESVIWTVTEKLSTCHSLQEIFDDLPVGFFFRIHRCHIISLSYLDGYKNNKVRVKGIYLPISRYFKSRLQKDLRYKIDTHIHFYEPSINIITHESTMEEYILENVE